MADRTTEKVRVMMLQGETGVVGCQIAAPMSLTMPRLTKECVKSYFSQGIGPECVATSHMRLRNLVAVRGQPGSSMVGPLNYYGNLNQPHMHEYTIDLSDVDEDGVGTPHVQATRAPFQTSRLIYGYSHDQSHICVPGKWISGVDLKNSGQEPKVPGYSLFPNPGILELQIDYEWLTLTKEKFPCVLQSFCAEIVPNDKPFSITHIPVHGLDDFRLVKYKYEPGYAEFQTGEHGGGCFLERHSFAQIITPLSPHCSGFVMLAQQHPRLPNKFVLIAVEIPFGSTLIVREGCIHGDTTLQGPFMMGMTSNHTAMQTADTVFLKNSRGKNIHIRMAGCKTLKKSPHCLRNPAKEMVLYRPFSLREMCRFSHDSFAQSQHLRLFDALGLGGRFLWLFLLYIIDHPKYFIYFPLLAFVLLLA